jgi:hypothetical protein
MKTKQHIKKKMEKFKNNQSFEYKYVNDPNKITKYRLEMDNKYKKSINNVFVSTNRIQTNRLDEIPKSNLSKPNLNIITQKSEKKSSIINKSDKINLNKKKSSVEFDPIAKNLETKYKLYHESSFY